MGKKLTFLVVAILFITMASFISAVPPMTQVGSFADGFDIKYPNDINLQQFKDYEFQFHVFNSSNGIPIEGDSDQAPKISCYFHLYNSSGTHQTVLTKNIATEIFDYSFYVDGANFTQLGQYSYIIQCNSSTQGGFNDVAFDVSYTGKNINESQSALYISLMGVIIFVFTIIILGINKLPKYNQTDEEGKILSITYLKYFRPVLWFFEYMLTIAILYLSSNLAFAYLNEQLFAQILFVLFRISLGLAPVVVIVWMIWIYVKMFHDRQFQKLLNRGIFPKEKP